MLKYLESAITFREVPDEVSLCISITNCPYECKGCHSPYLRRDIGEPLTANVIDRLINHYKESQAPLSCIVFMGDGGNFEELGKLVEWCHNQDYKTCIYTGSYSYEDAIRSSNFTLDYIKVGPYIEDNGPLDSKDTNQKFYYITYPTSDTYSLNDITYKFQKLTL